MRPRLTHAALAALALALAATADALAADQQISSTLVAEGYSVPSADGGSFMRRRIMEDLRLSLWNLLPGSSDPYYRGPGLSMELELRIDTDFAVQRAESDPSDLAGHVPGASPIALQAVVAYVAADGLWRGALDARVGRQIRLDTVGFVAFDGAELALNMPAGIRLSPFIGYEVRGGDILGWDAHELDGVDSGGRRGLESDRYPSRVEPSRRLAFGTELEWAPVAWLDAAAAIRIVGLSGPIADERIAGRLDVGRGPVRAHARLVWSPILNRRDDFAAAAAEGTAVREAEASLSITPVAPLTVSAEYSLYRPTFEADSIFNVFDLVPRRDVGGRAELEVARVLRIAGWGFARLAAGSAGIDGAASSSVLSGAGGGIGATYRTARRYLTARGTTANEWGESRIGAELGLGHGFLHDRLWFALRGSYWHIDDDLGSALCGDVGGYLASVRFRLLRGAHVAFELENYYGGGRAPRVVALGLLQLDLWR